jgi:hypothetical protein
VQSAESEGDSKDIPVALEPPLTNAYDSTQTSPLSLPLVIAVQSPDLAAVSGEKSLSETPTLMYDAEALANLRVNREFRRVVARALFSAGGFAFSFCCLPHFRSLRDSVH